MSAGGGDGVILIESLKNNLIWAMGICLKDRNYRPLLRSIWEASKKSVGKSGVRRAVVHLKYTCSWASA